MKQSDLKVEQIMTRPALSARTDTPAKEIPFEIFYGFFSGMPVTDGDGKVMGVVTEIDLLKQIRQGKDLGKIKADEITTKGPITVDINTSFKRSRVLLELQMISSTVSLSRILRGLC